MTRLPSSSAAWAVALLLLAPPLAADQRRPFDDSAARGHERHERDEWYERDEWRWRQRHWSQRYGYHRPGYRHPPRQRLPDNSLEVIIQGDTYYLSEGIYYRPERGGYVVVRPPVGQSVELLPAGYQTLDVNGETYFERGGVWYLWEPEQRRYRIINDPRFAGVAPARVLDALPASAEPVSLNGVDYLRYEGRYYLPSWQQGRPVYIQVEP